VTVAWLIGIARHKLVDHWRREARERRRLRAVEDLTDPFDDPWDAELDREAAHAALAELSPVNRAALTLRYLDGLAVPEVAEHLGRTVAATEQVLSRAKRAFRASYGEEGR
jgi:RNA polymerase sigma-70 factor, ECF subfamily